MNYTHYTYRCKANSSHSKDVSLLCQDMSIVDSYTNEIMVMIISSGAEDGKYTFRPVEYMYGHSDYRHKLLSNIMKYCHVTGKYDAYKDFGIYSITSDNSKTSLKLQSNIIEYIMTECMREGLCNIEDLPSYIVGSISNESKTFNKKCFEYKEQLKEYNYHNEKKYWCVQRIECKDSVLSPIIHTNYMRIDENGKYIFPDGYEKKITVFFETEENMKKIVKEIYDNYKKNCVDEEIKLNLQNLYTKRFDYNLRWETDDEDRYDNSKYLSIKDIIGEESDYKSEEDNCTGISKNIKYEYTQDDINNINLRKAKVKQDTNMLLDGKLNRDNYLAVWDNENKLFGIGKFEYHTIYTLNIANPDKDRRVYTLKELRELSHENTDIELNKVEEHIKKYHKKD